MSYIGRDIRTGAFRQLDDISSGFDGSDTTHTMQVNSTNVSVGDVNQILLSLGGVIQKPGTDFTVSGSTLTFTTAPAANTSFFAILLGSDNGGTVTPTDVSVTKAKLADSVDIFAGTSLSAADLGAGIHIKTGDSGGSAFSANDELVVEGSGDTGIQLLSGSSSEAGITFGDGDDPNMGLIGYDHANNRFRFKTNDAVQWYLDSSGNFLPAATDHGIYLGVTSATASNLLDDYEEGDFQVTTTYAGSGSWGLNTSNDTLHYIKVGKLVHIMGQIKVNAYSGASGIGYIDLPFAQAAQTEDGDTGTGEVQVLGASQNSNVFCINVYTGLARLYFDRHDATSLANAALAQFDSNMAINISISYHTS